MAYVRISIVVCVGLVMPALAAAQAVPPPESNPPLLPPSNLDGRQGPADMKKMYEDIETLRRLLNRAISTQQMSQCASCHGGSGTQSIAFSPDGRILAAAVDQTGTRAVTSWDDRTVRLWDVATGKQVGAHPSIPHPFTGAEGTYLQSVGVLYAVTLPIPPEGLRQAPRKPAPPQSSDWERTHRQVLGEPVETIVRERPVQPSLREIILKTLAENGRHFTQLGPNDQLSVVVTFRGGDVPRVGMGGMGGGFGGSGMGGGFGGGAMGGFGVGGVGGFGGVGAKGTFGGGGMGAGGSVGTTPPLGGFPGGGGGGGTPRQSSAEGMYELELKKPNSVRDYELLGDLVLKQGKVDEAINAYKTAVAMHPESDRLASLYRKLAQAYLARSQDNLALEVLQKASALAGKEARTKTPPRAPKVLAHLPAQLVISVPKRLADAYATGALSFDRFREAAHVELRKFTDSAQ